VVRQAHHERETFTPFGLSNLMSARRTMHMIVTVILNIAILKPAAEESRASRANTCRASGQILRCGSGWRWGAVTWKLVEGSRHHDTNF
jgi:hypothetical protein